MSTIVYRQLSDDVHDVLLGRKEAAIMTKDILQKLNLPNDTNHQRRVNLACIRLKKAGWADRWCDKHIAHGGAWRWWRTV